MKLHFREITTLILLSAVLSIVLVGVNGERGRAATDEQENHERWLLARIQEATAIKPGMSRADLLHAFDVPGGFQRHPPERYVLRTCHYINVDVQFLLPEPLQSRRIPPDSELKIVSVSRPYFKLPVAD